MSEMLRARYLIETPLDPVRVAEVLAGEQSSGTFVRVAGETDDLRARSRAVVEVVEELEPSANPSLPNAMLTRQGYTGPWRRARLEVAFPVDNINANLPTLAATVGGNLYDLGETTGLRLEHLTLPAAWRGRFERPHHGIDGTRSLSGVAQGPLIGTIIKPNVGLDVAATAALVGQLCEAGVDFIKDDEVCADPKHAPLAERVPTVMAQVRRWQDKSGKRVLMAFNISDEHDAMLRHAELIARHEGCCAMVSLNWCGFSSVQALRRHSDLILHGHRNGFGMFSRHPALGMDFQPYQMMWRLAGVDHMHVHGLQGKFAQADDEVIASAHDCLRPLVDATDQADRVLPAFSSGQWAGTLPATLAVVPQGDFLFMAGGGILAHPLGPTAGVTSLRQAWLAARDGVDLKRAELDAPELHAALNFFGKRR